jgi:hypothetical protein
MTIARHPFWSHAYIYIYVNNYMRNNPIIYVSRVQKYKRIHILKYIYTWPCPPPILKPRLYICICICTRIYIYMYIYMYIIYFNIYIHIYMWIHVYILQRYTCTCMYGYTCFRCPYLYPFMSVEFFESCGLTKSVYQ